LMAKAYQNTSLILKVAVNPLKPGFFNPFY
jgi:hypothetical protein